MAKISDCSLDCAVCPSETGGDERFNQRHGRRDRNIDGWRNVGDNCGGSSAGRSDGGTGCVWWGRCALLVGEISHVVDAIANGADGFAIGGELVALMALDSVEDKAAASSMLQAGAG